MKEPRLGYIGNCPMPVVELGFEFQMPSTVVWNYMYYFATVKN